MPTSHNCYTTFSIATTAGYYAGIAGVLAGFAFLGMTYVLTGQLKPDRSPDKAQALFPLLSAFISLILAAVEYSVLAGEQCVSQVAGRAASEELLGGVAFVFAVTELLYAVLVMMRDLSLIERHMLHAETLFLTVIPGLAVLLLMEGALDVSSIDTLHRNKQGFWVPGNSGLTRSMSVASIVLPLLVIMLTLIPRVPVAKRYMETREVPSWAREYVVPYATLGAALIAVVRSVFLSSAHPSARITEWENWTWPIGCAVVLVLISWLVTQPLGPGAGSLPRPDPNAGIST